MATQLSVTLRPKRLADFIGQPAAVAYVRGMMKKGDAPNLMLISGPSGTGKTTLARLVAAALSGWRRDPDANPDMRDVPANVERSIEDVRGLIQFSSYLPSGGRRRVIVVDEAHGYVGPAASALLKATEDPPPHVTWIFCTDQPWKLNRTMVGRAQSLALNLLDDASMTTVLTNAVEAAELDLGRHAAPIVARIVRMAHGSARQGIQLLESVHTSMTGGAGAREALALAVESNPAVEGFDAAIAYLTAVLARDPRAAVSAIGGGTGDGVLELANMMLAGLVRRACGLNPRDGVGWAVSKKIRVGAEQLPQLLDLQARLVAAMDVRSRFFVPSDSLLFALARDVGR